MSSSVEQATRPLAARRCFAFLIATVLAFALERPLTALVDMRNANYADTWFDFDGDYTFQVSRTYNSRTLFNGMFGFGWCSQFETTIEITAEANVRLTVCGAGLEDEFHRSDFNPTEVDALVDRIIARLKADQQQDPRSLTHLIGSFSDRAWALEQEELRISPRLRTQLARAFGMARPIVDGTVFRNGKGGSVTFDRGEFVWFDGEIESRFDRQGRRISSRQANGNLITYEYEERRLKRVARAADGARLEFDYGSNGKVARVTNQDGKTAEYKYSPTGDMVGQRNSWNNSYALAYDDLHNLTRIEYPDGTFKRLSYDTERDWVISFRDRNGCFEDYTYVIKTLAHFGSYITKSCERENTEYYYEFEYKTRPGQEDYLQRVVMERTDGATRTDILYNERGQPTFVGRDGREIRYEYDNDGRRLTRRVGRVVLTYKYVPETSIVSEWVETEFGDDGNVVRERSFDKEPPSPPGKPIPPPNPAPHPLFEFYVAARTSSAFVEAASMLDEWDAALRRAGETTARIRISGIAFTYGVESLNTKRFDVALRLFRTVAAIGTELGQDDMRFRALSWIARTHVAQGDHAAAAKTLEETITSMERSPGVSSERLASFRTDLARIYRDMGRYSAAYDALKRTLDTRSGTNAVDRDGMIAFDAQDLLADLYGDVGLYSEALSVYRDSRRAIELMWDVPDDGLRTTGMARQVADLLNQLGKPDAASVLLERQLTKLKATSEIDTPFSAGVMRDAGLYLTFAGEYERALPLLDEAVRIFEGAGEDERAALADALGDRAVLYNRLGQHDEAIAGDQRSVDILQALSRDDLAMLGNLAASLRDVGRYRDAIEVGSRVVARARERYPTGHYSIGNNLYHLGESYRLSGQLTEAVSALSESASILENTIGTSHWRVARAMGALGRVYLAQGQLDEAESQFQRAADVAAQSRDPEQIWISQYNLGAVNARLGRRAVAVMFQKQAVNSIQSMRSRLMAIDAQTQTSFLRDKTRVYRELADLLIDLGRLPEAQQVLGLIKTEEFFDFVRRDDRQDPRNVQLAFTPQEQAWSVRYDEIGGRVAALGREMDGLKRKAQLGLTGAEQARRDKLEADLGVARNAFDAFIADFMKELATASADRNREVGERNLTSLRALQQTLRDLGHGAVALHYLMAPSKLRILLTTPSAQIGRDAPIGEADLNRSIERFRTALASPSTNPLPAAQALYDVLIRPVAEDLKQAGAETLMVSLDGTLRYIPMAALHDGAKYLVASYNIAIMTEAAKAKLKDRPRAAWRLAGLGVTRAMSGFDALPGVQAELEGIVRRKPGTGVLPGEMYLDDSFTMVRMRNVLDQKFPVLHIASHFAFKPGTESDSFLLLGDGSKLTLRDIRDRDFDFGGVDLITLSACETAIGGGVDGNGQEIEGFGALVQKQGATGVLATLWSVQDASTGLFMQQLYKIRQTDKLTKAEAVRRVQLMMLSGGLNATAPAATRGGRAAGQPTAGAKYSHPYYWAPFILMGNWL